MRGRVDSQGDVFHTFHIQDLIPAGHPLREIKRRADAVLASMSRDFNAAYGTLVQSCASLKSVRPIESSDTQVSDGAEDADPGNPTVNFRGQKRRNATHRSLVDPEARLARTRFVGRWKIAQQAYITGAAYNLLRLARLSPARA